jgi:hypothetical protein
MFPRNGVGPIGANIRLAIRIDLVYRPFSGGAAMHEQDIFFTKDWEVIKSLLPDGWEEKANELGALRRKRGFSSEEKLLRTLLIHIAEGISFRETAVRAKEGVLADVSDVALLKRLRQSGPWLSWLAHGVMEKWLGTPLREEPAGIGRIRVMDGTTIQRPGAKTTTWRIHYSMQLPSMQCDEVKVTGRDIGESLRLFTIEPGDLIMGDRGLAHRAGIHHVVSQGGDVLVRVSLASVPFYDKQGGRFELLQELRRLKPCEIGDWEVEIEYGDYRVFGRICAIRKTERATKESQEKLLRESRKKGRKVRPATLEAAGYTMVFTTLDRNISADTVLTIYRARWQVELVFKRLKSILGLGSLHKVETQSAKAWLHGKLLVAFLIEALKVAGERFFPWGYPIQAESGRNQIPVERNAAHAAFSPTGRESDQLAHL